MATRNQVLSLFGATPQQIQEQERLRQAQFIASQRDPYQSAGAAIGVGLGRLFGGKSEAEQQAEQMQQAIQGVDTTNPEALRELARTVQQFAPERSLQILDRATQIENQELSRKADELSIEAASYKLNQARETDPLRLEGLELANRFKTAQLDVLRSKEEDRQEALDALEQQRSDAVTFLNNKGLEDYARLVEDKLIDPDKAVSAYIEAQQNDSLNITEVGNYTIGDREVIGALDTDKGIFYELNPDGGWIRRPANQVTQGKKASEAGAGGRETPRVLSETLTNQYDTAYDNIVSTVEETDPSLYTAMTKEGLIYGRNELSAEERIGLYEQADSILRDKDRYPNINTTEAALRQAITEKAYGIETTSDATNTVPATAEDPYAGAPIK